MAVFRVERNKGYTVMSNHHLRKDNPYRRGRLPGRACQGKVYEAQQQPH